MVINGRFGTADREFLSDSLTTKSAYISAVLRSAAMKLPQFAVTRRVMFVAACVFVCLVNTDRFTPIGHAKPAAPPELSDKQFWSLSRDSSEEDGFFRSDNLLSNETTFQYIIPDLLKIAKQGRVYM